MQVWLPDKASFTLPSLLEALVCFFFTGLNTSFLTLLLLWSLNYPKRLKLPFSFTSKDFEYNLTDILLLLISSPKLPTPLNRTSWCKTTFIGRSLSFWYCSTKATDSHKENHGNTRGQLYSFFGGICSKRNWSKYNANSVFYPRQSTCFSKSWQKIPASPSFYRSAISSAVLSNSPHTVFLRGLKLHVQICTLNHKTIFSLLNRIELSILKFWTLKFGSLLRTT